MKMKLLVCCVLMLACVMGCGDSNTSSKLSSDVVGNINKTLSDYEALRAALAEDRLDDIAGIAAKIETSSVAAKKGAPADVTTRLDNMNAAAKKLKAGGKAEAQRLTFGELSKAVVGMLSEHKELATNLNVFECPMADGYKQWVQSGDQLENPYMGQRMLKCGHLGEWTP